MLFADNFVSAGEILGKPKFNGSFSVTLNFWCCRDEHHIDEKIWWFSAS
jgi:hypothetical protein